MAEQSIEVRKVPSKKARGFSADEKSRHGGSGSANLQTGNVPSVQVGGSFEEAALPAMPGTLKIGDDKNVSTPVSG